MDAENEHYEIFIQSNSNSRDNLEHGGREPWQAVLPVLSWIHFETDLRQIPLLEVSARIRSEVVNCGGG